MKISHELAYAARAKTNFDYSSIVESLRFYSFSLLMAVIRKRTLNSELVDFRNLSYSDLKSNASQKDIKLPIEVHLQFYNFLRRIRLYSQNWIKAILNLFQGGSS